MAINVCHMTWTLELNSKQCVLQYESPLGGEGLWQILSTQNEVIVLSEVLV